MSILKEMQEKLPADANISEVKFEGSEIVMYTKNKDFFTNSEPSVKELVRELKKRVEVRPDISICSDPEKTKKIIQETVPEGAGIVEIYFEPELGKVVIEAQKPGLIIGKGGETFKRIKNGTLWLPKIERAPAIKSDVVRAVRNLLHSELDYRKKFLNMIGQKINQKPEKDYDRNKEWVRLSTLGGFRQVGRSSMLLQTSLSSILIDCGIDVASDQFPYLNAPEFSLEKLDAIVLSHAHLDHCGYIPHLYEAGYTGPLYCSADYNEPVMVKIDGMIRNLPIGRIADGLIEKSEKISKIPENDFISAEVGGNIEVPAFSFKDYKITFRPLKAVIRHKITDDLFELKVKTGRTVKVTGSHSVFTIRNGEVKEVKVNELKIGDYVVVPHKLPGQALEEIQIPNELNSGKFKLPTKIALTKELMRILGYFTAEGSLEKRSLRFSFGLRDEKIMEDLVHCVNMVFGLRAKIGMDRETRARVNVNSKSLRLLFSRIFFPEYEKCSKATAKRIPDVVFNVGDELKLEFLRAYFAGDGYVNHANKTVDAITVSKGLITDLSYLCSQIGFNYTLFERIIPSAKTKNMVYKITINFSDFFEESVLRKSWSSCGLLPLNETGFNEDWYYHRLKNRFHVTKQRLLELMTRNQIKLRGSNTAQVQEILSKLANSDLAFLPITDLRKVKPTTEFVYDFSVDDDENFVGGSAPICLHNTAPTRDLMVLLCLDYIDVCQKEGKHINYSKKAVEKAVKHSVVLDYGEVSDIARNVRLTLQPAGHLLGSSLVHLHVGDGLHNILYTGDLKFGPSRLFDPAFTDFQRVETLIIESTYSGQGDFFPSMKEADANLLMVIDEAMKKGGKILIPSFAVGRAQEVMAILGSMKFDYPIWIEGMLWDATAIHTAYPEYLSQRLQRDIFHHGRNPFLSESFKYVAPRERNAVIDSGEPGVIIATSGMLIGGPAMEYLKGLAPDRKNTLMFVGYQAEGTLGRRLQKGWKEIPVRSSTGKTTAINMEMEVRTIEGLSGHSDRNQLLSYMHRLGSRPERIIVNHGEQHKTMDMARDLHKIFRCETLAPKNLEAVRLR